MWWKCLKCQRWNWLPKCHKCNAPQDQRFETCKCGLPAGPNKGSQHVCQL